MSTSIQSTINSKVKKKKNNVSVNKGGWQPPARSFEKKVRIHAYVID